MLLAISGKIGHGKSSIAKILVEKHGFIEYSFADPLKKAVKELFLFSDEQLYGTQVQKAAPDSRWFGISPRQILQFTGTELLRDQMKKLMPDLGENIFVHRAKLWFEAEVKSNPDIKVVISDLRFPNECSFVKTYGKVLRVTRPNYSHEIHTHASETALDGEEFDFTFDNSGSIVDLELAVDTYIATLQKEKSVSL
jgi:dephospho-CoA kinase